MTTFTDVQIANIALNLLGEPKAVTAVDGTDTSALGTIVGQVYYATRDEEMKAYPWLFGIKRAAITAGVAPTNGYVNQYPVPSDCLRILDVYAVLSSPTQYGTLSLYQTQRWGYIIDQSAGLPGTIYTMVGPFGTGAYIKYIYESTTSTNWDIMFCEVLAIRLAAKMAPYIKKSLEWKQRMEQEYNLLIARAYQLNVIEPMDNYLVNPWFGDRRPFDPRFENKPLIPAQFKAQQDLMAQAQQKTQGQ